MLIAKDPGNVLFSAKMALWQTAKLSGLDSAAAIPEDCGDKALRK